MNTHRDSYSFYDSNKIFEIALRSSLGDRDDQQDSSGLMLKYHEGIVAVADGMGGSQGGKLAADITIKGIMDRYELIDRIPDFSSFFYETAKELDAKVSKLNSDSGIPLGAGTTVVCVAIRPDQLSWLSVGDSRIYLCRNGELIQLTKDHNYLSALKDGLACGEIAQETFEIEKEKGEALISYIGIGDLRLADINQIPFRLLPNDLILLTSDGLYKVLDETVICNLLSNFTSISEAATVLEQKVKSISKRQNISRDNTTFAIIKVF